MITLPRQAPIWTKTETNGTNDKIYANFVKNRTIWVAPHIIACILGSTYNEKVLDMKEYMAVAETIRNQIRDGACDNPDGRRIAGFIAMQSWGADNFVGQPGGDESYGGLCFSVKGAKFRGAVKITLMLNDTYRVQFWRTRRPNLKMVHEMDGVYFDMLTNIIDGYVERTEAA